MQTQQQPNIMEDLLNRIRAIESKYTILGEQLLVVNENTIDSYKDLAKEIKVMNQEMQEIRQDLSNFKETIKQLVKETEMFARKEQIKVLEKYINLWNPMEFVTTEEVNKIIEEKLKKIKKTGGSTAKKRTRRKGR